LGLEPTQLFIAWVLVRLPLITRRESIRSLHLASSGTLKAKFQTFGDELFIDTLTAGKSIYFRTGVATTALTLDSAQNATFAGNVTSGTYNKIVYDSANGFGYLQSG
jgi:hypothetical protein